MSELEELKHLMRILPALKKQYDRSELVYLRQCNSQVGKEQDGYIYHITPMCYGNYTTSKNEYEQSDNRRWELIQSLGLSCCIDGTPDFGERNIKPYGWDRTEISFFDCNSPIDRP